MPSGESGSTPSVGLLGSTTADAAWLASLSGERARLVPIPDPSQAPDDVDVVVAWSARGSHELSELLGRMPVSVPAVLLVGAPGPAEHPHVRFVQAILDAKRDWEAAFDTMVDAVLVVDEGGRLTRANRALAERTGVALPAMIGRPYGELLGVAVGGTRDVIAASLADRKPRQAEVRFEKLAGISEVGTSPYSAGHGSRGLVAIIQDVTEQRAQEDRLSQAVRLADVGQLAAGVAHEINTPLASIALRAESLLRSAQDPRLQQIDSFRNFPRYLKTIEEEIFRCKKIIGGLLDFARSRPPEIRDVDLNALAERAVDLLTHQAGLRQVDLRFAGEPGLPPVPVDEGQFRQVLLGLLMNAVDATPAGGSVEVTTLRRDDRVLLRVADTGAGIAPENLDKIWSPFFTTKPAGRGTGLGLAICHGVVTAHGGTIEVESEVGRGTRFTVGLPAERRASEER